MVDFEQSCNRVNPESIRIIGSKVRGSGEISEADVRFKDNCGNPWYITIIDGDEHLLKTLNEAGRVEPDDVTNSDEDNDPPDFVWNGRLDQATIVEILGQQTMKLLAPHVIPLAED